MIGPGQYKSMGTGGLKNEEVRALHYRLSLEQVCRRPTGVRSHRCISKTTAPSQRQLVTHPPNPSRDRCRPLRVRTGFAQHER